MRRRRIICSGSHPVYHWADSGSDCRALRDRCADIDFRRACGGDIHGCLPGDGGAGHIPCKEDRQQGPSILHSVLSGRRRTVFCSGCPEICRLWQRRNRIYTDAFPDAESKEKHERESYPGAVYASGTQSYRGRDADSFGGQDENDGRRIPGEVPGRVSE